MCFTGGFTLAMMVDPAVVAPVLSQPSLPFAIGRKGKRDLGISGAHIQKARARMQDEGICLLGLRFTGDTLVPEERFDRMREELGSGFVAVELDRRPATPTASARRRTRCSPRTSSTSRATLAQRAQPGARPLPLPAARAGDLITRRARPRQSTVSAPPSEKASSARGLSCSRVWASGTGP